LPFRAEWAGVSSLALAAALLSVVRRMSRELAREDHMLIQFSIVLTSQLVIAVADGPPNFDIARGCKVDSASAFDPKAGMDATIKRCMDDEQKAKDQLDTQWVGFMGSDRAMCTSEVVGNKADAGTTPSSYVDLLTCLQDQQLARKLPKN
jgi:hypothetical protein